jgi:putative ABC transport system permease protein
MASRSRALVRTAPWTRAPLLAFREPAVAVVIGAVAFVIGLVAASGPLFDASSGSGALSLEMADQCQSLTGTIATGEGPLQGVTQASGSLLALSDRSLSRAGAPAAALSPPRTTLDTQVSAGRSTDRLLPAQLVTDPSGLSHVERLAGRGGPGVWISGDTASELRVRPGERIWIGRAGPGNRKTARDRVRVAGIYRSLVGTTLPAYWCGLTPIFGYPDENAPPPPVMLTSGGEFDSVLHAARIPTVDFLQWERTPAPVDLERAHAVAAAVHAFRVGVGAASTGEQEHPLRLPGGIRAIDAIPEQYGFLVSHADAVQTAVSHGVIPEIVSGVVVGVLLVASAAVFWAYRRRNEVVLLLSRGAPPASLGLKAAFEATPLMGLGALAGWVGSVVLLSLVGPSTAFGSSALLRSALVTVAVDLVALVILGVVAAFVSATRQRSLHSVPAGIRKVPFEVAGIGIALWLWSSLGTVSLEAGGTNAPAVPSGFLVMPLLLLLSGSVLIARLASIPLRRCRRLRLGHARMLAFWLTLRRLAAAPGLAMLMVGSVAVAIGTFTYAGAMSRSQQYTLEAKASTFVGSNVAVTTVNPVRMPRSMVGSSTEVLTESSGTVGTRFVGTLGINPASFARGAFWDPSYSQQSLGSLLGELTSAKSSAASVPVILAGPDAPSFASGLQFPYGASTGPVHLHVIARTSTFPGQNGENPLIVMKRSDLARVDPAAMYEIWTKDSESAALSRLSHAGIHSASVLAAKSELGQIEFAPIHWTFEALQALGVLIGVLAYAGLCLFLTARARARSLAYGLGRRMGVSRRTHLVSLGAEIGLLLGTALAIGISLAWVTTLLVDGLLNPLPNLPPRPLLIAPWPSIIIALVAALIGWVSFSLWTQHVTENRSTAEVLRYDID